MPMRRRKDNRDGEKVVVEDHNKQDQEGQAKDFELSLSLSLHHPSLQPTNPAVAPAPDIRNVLSSSYSSARNKNSPLQHDIDLDLSISLCHNYHG